MDDPYCTSYLQALYGKGLPEYIGQSRIASFWEETGHGDKKIDD